MIVEDHLRTMVTKTGQQ
jgi:hypothetical protein